MCASVDDRVLAICLRLSHKHPVKSGNVANKQWKCAILVNKYVGCGVATWRLSAQVKDMLVWVAMEMMEGPGYM